MPCVSTYTLSAAPGLPEHVTGIIIGAIILVVVFTMFTILTVAAGYYYKRNKVVIVKVCMHR